MIIRTLLLASVLLSPLAQARAYLAILIDDLGDNLERGRAILQLPKPVSVAIIPYRPYSIELAQVAHALQRDVLLHMPMSNVVGSYASEGLLSPKMSRSEFIMQAQANLDAIPGIVGINNHMGSEMTRFYPQMRWLMQALYSRDLFFVDSRTTAATMAQQAASDSMLRHDRRYVFLDNDDVPESIAAQLDKAIEYARQNGFAIAIGHPRRNTIAVLQQRFNQWQENDVELVGLSHYMALKQAN